jgi:hypothetical protein
VDSDTNSAHLPRSPRGINHYFLAISKAALPQWSVMRWHEVSRLHAALDVDRRKQLGAWGFRVVLFMSFALAVDFLSAALLFVRS